MGGMALVMKFDEWLEKQQIEETAKVESSPKYFFPTNLKGQEPFETMVKNGHAFWNEPVEGVKTPSQKAEEYCRNKFDYGEKYRTFLAGYRAAVEDCLGIVRTRGINYDWTIEDIKALLESEK